MYFIQTTIEHGKTSHNKNLYLRLFTQTTNYVRV